MDKPPAPSLIDKTIFQHDGLTVAFDLMPKALQESKGGPTPSLKEMIETLSKENGRLREELAYYRNLQEVAEELRQDVDYVIERLKMAVCNFQKGHDDLKRELGGTLTVGKFNVTM